MTRAYIDYVTVGNAFGCRGRARTRIDGKTVTVYSTPTMPFGFVDEAQRAAARWADDNGYEVDPAYLAPPVDLIETRVEQPERIATPGKIEIAGVVNPWGRRP